MNVTTTEPPHYTENAAADMAEDAEDMAGETGDLMVETLEVLEEVAMDAS